MAATDYDDDEFNAMREVFGALKALPDDDARTRVLTYAASRLGLGLATSMAKLRSDAPTEDPDDDESDAVATAPQPVNYSSFAELFDAALPKSNADRALVAGYWLQVCQGAESFGGQAVNTELKHLGEAIANITNALESLKIQKPALALQLKKSGKSQQARKSYKITVAGVRAVEAMING